MRSNQQIYSLSPERLYDNFYGIVAKVREFYGKKRGNPEITSHFKAVVERVINDRSAEEQNKFFANELFEFISKDSDPQLLNNSQKSAFGDFYFALCIELTLLKIPYHNSTQNYITTSLAEHTLNKFHHDFSPISQWIKEDLTIDTNIDEEYKFYQLIFQYTIGGDKFDREIAKLVSEEMLRKQYEYCAQEGTYNKVKLRKSIFEVLSKVYNKCGDKENLYDGFHKMISDCIKKDIFLIGELNEGLIQCSIPISKELKRTLHYQGILTSQFNDVAFQPIEMVIGKLLNKARANASDDAAIFIKIFRNMNTAIYNSIKNDLKDKNDNLKIAGNLILVLQKLIENELNFLTKIKSKASRFNFFVRGICYYYEIFLTDCKKDLEKISNKSTFSRDCQKPEESTTLENSKDQLKQISNDSLQASEEVNNSNIFTL